MGWFSRLVGAPDASSVVSATGNALDSLFTSDEERAQAAAVMAKIKQNPQMWQAQINMISAGHRSVFVAGWRPFIGWVCGTGLGFVFVFNPIIQWATGEPGPEMPIQALMSLVVSLLGLAGYRTVEKVQGASK